MCERGVENEVLSVEGWDDSSECKFESLARKFESLARKFESPYGNFKPFLVGKPGENAVGEGKRDRKVWWMKF